VAECTGYSSFADGVTQGPFKGPTETSWTTTFTGTAVRWGKLTLSTPPETTGTSDMTASDGLDATGSDAGVSGGTAATTELAESQASAGGPLEAAAAWRWAVMPMVLGAILG